MAVDWKPQRVTDLVVHIHDIVRAQYKDLERALHGQGEYQLVPHFMTHAVPHSKWTSMSEERQTELFNAFMKDNGIRTKSSSVQSTGGHLTVQGNSKIAHKPGQRKRVKPCRTRVRNC